MKTTAVLDKIKNFLEQIDPRVGQIHSTLLSSPKQEDVITGLKFEGNGLGAHLRAFIVRPGDSVIRRGTTGNTGFSMRLRNIEIQGLISIQIDNEGAAERVLEDQWEVIIRKLASESRLEAKSRGDAFLKGEMTLSPMLPPVVVANHNALVQILTVVVQDRLN